MRVRSIQLFTEKCKIHIFIWKKLKISDCFHQKNKMNTTNKHKVDDRINIFFHHTAGMRVVDTIKLYGRVIQ